MNAYDPAPDRGPLTPGERWAFGLFLAGLVGLFVAEVLTNYQPAKLSALLVVLFWVPLIAVHEAGHAVAARLLGWRVSLLVVGMGRTVAAFRVGGLPVELRLFPVEGFVRTTPADLTRPRVKSALIYLAGPAAGLLPSLAVLAALGWDRLFTRTDGYAVIAAQSLAVAGAAQFVLNLIPSAVRGQGGTVVANDGLGVILSFLRPAEDYAAMAAAGDEPA